MPPEPPPTSYSVGGPPTSVDMAVNAIKQNEELRKENEWLRGLVEEAYKEGRPDDWDVDDAWLYSDSRKRLMEGK